MKRGQNYIDWLGRSPSSPARDEHHTRAAVDVGTIFSAYERLVFRCAEEAERRIFLSDKTSAGGRGYFGLALRGAEHFTGPAAFGRTAAPVNAPVSVDVNPKVRAARWLVLEVGGDAKLRSLAAHLENEHEAANVPADVLTTANPIRAGAFSGVTLGLRFHAVAP